MGFEEEIGSFGDDFTWNRYVGIGTGFDDGVTEHDPVYNGNDDPVYNGNDDPVYNGYDGGCIFFHNFSKWGWTLSDKECDQTYNDHEFNFTDKNIIGIDWNVIGISSDTIFTYESGRAATTH